ncbi:MAG: uroporphyrinogen decarboxylase family protein [Victivallaceae bacterium]|nr:uroporphyrinogen decarboxylase family protein [Victivallaceae bacterium]
MSSRERVLAVLNKACPDMVPRALYDVAINTYNESTIAFFKKKTGKHPGECFRQDIRGIRMTPVKGENPQIPVRLENPCPRDIDKLLSWQISNPRIDFNELKKRVEAIHAIGCAAMAVGMVSDFETAFELRGREQFFIDIACREEWLNFFLDKITDAAVRDAESASRAGADIFGIGDDLGSQKGLLISPVTWRNLFKPRLKRIIDAVHNNSPATRFFLHSDGFIEELIPDFIEIGVDILNPIQPEVMDPAEIKKNYGKKLIFFGAVSVQQTLPLGTPEDVFAEVKLRMETIGCGGGYIMTPSHLLNEDIPWENIAAFFEAADKYGRYY